MEVETDNLKRITLQFNLDKLHNDEFYHLVFAPKPKISMWELPIPYLINNRHFELIDLAYENLFTLDPELIMLSHEMTQVNYYCYLIKKYGHRITKDTEMMICKFKKCV